MGKRCWGVSGFWVEFKSDMSFPEKFAKSKTLYYGLGSIATVYGSAFGAGILQKIKSMSSLVTRPSYIRQRLAEEGIHPSKALGQNFLADGNIMQLIVDAAGVQSTDHVLEIGPGLGALTVSLLRQADRVTCIEKDKKLATLLRQEFSTRPTFHILQKDALDVKFDDLLTGPSMKVVSNLPYSVGTRIIMQLLQIVCPPERMVFMLQKDVAEKFTALPGSKPYGLTAVWSQRLYEVDLIHTVSPSCFIPPPRVASGIIRMQRRDLPLAKLESRDTFESITRYAFEHRRKQLGKILLEYPGGPRSRKNAEDMLHSVGLSHEKRPETASPGQWGNLANLLHARQ